MDVKINKRYWNKIRKTIAGLRWYDREETSRCGIYMLRYRDVTQYLGKTVDLDARISQHRREGKFPFDTVRFAIVPLEILDDVERELLLQYTPPKNNIFPARDHGPILNSVLRAERLARRQERQQSTPQPTS